MARGLLFARYLKTVSRGTPLVLAISEMLIRRSAAMPTECALPFSSPGGRNGFSEASAKRAGALLDSRASAN